MEVFSVRAEKVFALRATAAVALVCLYKRHAGFSGIFSFADINECVERNVNGTACSVVGQFCTNIDGDFNCDCPLLTEEINGTCAGAR